jgi:hypothetical protein
MAKSPLEVVFEFCNIDQEHIDHVKKTLYKYKDDPVVNLVCTIINENAAGVTRFNELLTEANASTIKTWPLIIPSPNSPTELRVFPNIILDEHNSLEGISSSYCNSQLKTFLTDYDADMADEKRKQKWTPYDRAEKRLLEFLDMPTARALTRYVFTDGKLKDNQIRDFAEAIDAARKPMELIFTETPQDYYTMYATGPNSCMSMNTAQERANWEFLKEAGMAPTSWYHYCQYTTGVYALKAGKVAARTILFKGENDKNWGWIRIYASNDEMRKKFIDSLAEQGIIQCQKPVIPQGYSFNVPGSRKGSVWAAPWAYLDAPLPSGHHTGEQWHVKFNKEDNSFTYFFNDNKYDLVNSRSGHIISSDYSTISCTSCGKVIKKGASLNIRMEHEYHIFCSDVCATVEGFVKVIEGTGNTAYKMPDDSMITVDGSPLIRFSTMQAAKDHDYHPMMEEPGIFPEEGGLQVCKSACLTDATGKYYSIRRTGFENVNDYAISSKVPFKLNPAKKVVEYHEDRLFSEVA